MNAPRISAVDYLPRFEKALSKLDKRIKEAVKEAIEDIQKSPVPPGRRLHKMSGYDNVWEVRATSSFRLTFELQGSTAIFRNVGSHDHLLRNP